jgi:hypothetical protein
MVHGLVYGVWAGVWCMGWCMVHGLVYGVLAGVWCFLMKEHNKEGEFDYKLYVVCNSKEAHVSHRLPRGKTTGHECTAVP